ncbi:hypothetical protein F53441_277 [Fusarium austroafricanum]|uniref:Uncharacterized protein n=1 Tax=Fusarium austroafricanum TaxID=2364996 RepID=A0A8H4KYE8_9HYPO|nr:hypothetical protein F53441_277 [Fusarium austroafricanum]
MGAAESKPPRSVGTKRRAGQAAGEPESAAAAGQPSRGLRRARAGEVARSSLSPTGAGKNPDVPQKLVEIPFNAEAYLLAKAALAKALDADASEPGEGDEIAEIEDEGTRPYVPSVHAHIKGVDKACRNGDWSRPLQRFLNRLQMGTNNLSVIYDSDLQNVGIEPPEETDAWVEQSEPSKFAGHVYRFLGRQCRSASSDRHLYVLYHPDAEWHADFYDLLADKPLPSNFLGFSDNLDALVAFVRFMRKRLGKRANNAMFHLLIPSSRPMSIRDALEFPDLGDLVIHGETHNGSNYVWVNLPTTEEYPNNLLLKHVENAVRAESEWKTSATVSTAIGGLSASLAGAAFTLRVKGAPFPSLKTFGFAAVCTTIARRVKGAEYLPLAVLGMGGVCTMIAAMSVNRALSKRVPRLIGGTDTPKEPKPEQEKEDSAASEKEESKDEQPEEEDIMPEPREEPPVVPEEPSKIKDDSDAQSFVSKASSTTKSSSSRKHRRSERSERKRREK